MNEIADSQPGTDGEIPEGPVKGEYGGDTADCRKIQGNAGGYVG